MIIQSFNAFLSGHDARKFSFILLIGNYYKHFDFDEVSLKQCFVALNLNEKMIWEVMNFLLAFDRPPFAIDY